MKSLRLPELAIAVIVVAVVAMLIVPLPTALLDILLAFNIAFAVALLMAALFSRRPIGFASFPTLLVVTTLFRVGLEVSATRLILADADAGEVVAAFGGSVVAGSLVVGLVVFAVITIVQLVVVSRGAERVAEVAARFALDAMPGKQMAIDAELRTGAIDAETARARRGELERESQLYGAMDGAMRFVKGDAIAAIIIVVINLVGGMVIGVGSRGMTAADAAKTYSLLSIGEGLVAQIPSLLVAVASGLLVTRVASTGDRALGEDLGEQLASPRALGAVAILLALLAIVPGLPMIPFLVLGAIAAAAAIASLRMARPGAPSLDEAGATTRLALVVPDAVAKDLPALHAKLRAIRAELTAQAGFAIPPLAVARGAELAVKLDGTIIAWPKSLDAVGAALAGALPELVTIDLTAQLVERAAQTAPIVVREVIPKLVALPALAATLRQLVREQVPIDDLAAILEAIALAPADTPVLAEHVRGHLRRQISARWAPKGQLAVFTIDGMIEDAVRGAIDRRQTGAPILALEPAIAQDIIAAARAKLGDAPAVILASGDIRRHLRSLLEPTLPDVTVLAAHELAPGTSIRTSGTIEV